MVVAVELVEVEVDVGLAVAPLPAMELALVSALLEAPRLLVDVRLAVPPELDEAVPPPAHPASSAAETATASRRVT